LYFGPANSTSLQLAFGRGCILFFKRSGVVVGWGGGCGSVAFEYGVAGNGSALAFALAFADPEGLSIGDDDCGSAPFLRGAASTCLPLAFALAFALAVGSGSGN